MVHDDVRALRLVDVGSAGGIQGEWLPHADKVSPTLFEPNPHEAEKLRGTLASLFHSGIVLETGLSNVVGIQPLNLTRYWGCSSLRQPNPDVLSNYRIAPIFDVVETALVECTRYDVLYDSGAAPAPDAIKIDVQGYEYEVLQGFGGLLQGCIGIKLETHVYPIYRGQKLLHDLVSFLRDFDFVLRRIEPVPSFDGDVVELDVWFTKDIRNWERFDTIQKEKFELICGVWKLIDYGKIDKDAPHTQLPSITLTD